MPINNPLEALQLTEEEAYAILVLCLTSPQKLDSTSEKAVRKLAEFCSRQGREQKSNYSNSAQPMQHVS